MDRYDNTREITNSLIKRIMLQSTMKVESSSGLQQLLDTTSECIRSLKVLGRPVEHWDDLLVFIIVEKLDLETRREWAMALKGTDPPTYRKLQEFLEQHVRGLQAGGQSSHQASKPIKSERKNSSSSNHITTDASCPVCKNNHELYTCQTFKSMTPEERMHKVKNSSLCSNCLKGGHISRSCPSKGSCKKCGKRHNTLLHLEFRRPITT